MTSSAVVADGVRPVWSHACALDDLVVPYVVPERAFARLDVSDGWSRTWAAEWKTGAGEVVCAVRDLADAPAMLSVPMRRFSWSPRQFHRPGLECLVSTGRQHGFESLAERRLLVALDFVSGVREVLSQPFRLRFTSSGGSGSHIPDFLALTPGAAWLLDVRPAGRIKEEDEVRFAAAGRAASAAGWRYAVVTGWHRQVMTGIDSLSAQRRPMADPLHLQRQLLQGIDRQPLRFGDLVDRTCVPAVARCHAVHLLWHRSLALDLTQPFGDSAWIYPVRRV